MARRAVTFSAASVTSAAVPKATALAYSVVNSSGTGETSQAADRHTLGFARMASAFRP